jgi:hypothetical protein
MALETELLADLIDRKHECLVHLWELSRRQIELVERNQIAMLLDLLVHKQRALSALNKIERALDPFRGQAPETRRWATPEDRRRCADRISACEGLLAEIVRQEKQAESELIVRRDETAAQLQGVHAAQEARGAYNSAAALPPQGIGLDLTSES